MNTLAIMAALSVTKVVYHPMMLVQAPVVDAIENHGMFSMNGLSDAGSTGTEGIHKQSRHNVNVSQGVPFTAKIKKGDSIGYYEQANLLQLNNALDAAALAQKQREKTGLEVRQSISMNIGNELMARREERGRLLSREEGKPLGKGMGEICSSYSPREKGRYAEEFYTTVKTSYIAAGQPD